MNVSNVAITANREGKQNNVAKSVAGIDLDPREAAESLHNDPCARAAFNANGPEECAWGDGSGLPHFIFHSSEFASTHFLFNFKNLMKVQ